MKKTTAHRTELDAQFNLVSDLNNQTPPPSVEKSVMDAYTSNAKKITKLHRIISRVTKPTTKYTVSVFKSSLRRICAQTLLLTSAGLCVALQTLLLPRSKSESTLIAMNNYHDDCSET